MKKILLLIMLFLLPLYIVKAEELKIDVESIKIIDKSDTLKVVDPVYDNKEVLSNIRFNELNEYVTYEIVIKNNDDVSHTLNSIEDDNKNNNIKIEYDYSNEPLESSESMSIKMNIKYDNLAKNVDVVKLDDIVVKLVFNDGEKEISPKTGDNIYLYIIAAVIAMVIFVVSIILLKKSKNKNLLILLALLLPIFVVAKNTLSITITFKNIEIVGKFDVFEVDVDYDNELENEKLNIKYGDKLGELEEPMKDGYTFIGWFDEDDNEVDKDTIVTSDLNIKAKYSTNEYIIHYYNDNGVHNNATKYTILDEVILSDDIKEGYDFLGWYLTENFDGDKVTSIPKGSIGDKDFYAKFQIKEYHVRYTYENEDIDNIIKHGDKVGSLPIPTKDGYNFIGWYDEDNNKVSENTIVTKELNLIDKYEIIKYNITYNTNGGETDNPISYTVLDEVNLSNATRNGYKFLGWYLTETFDDDKVTSIPKGSTGDKEFFANWELEEYTITYNLNDGVQEANPITKYYIDSDTFDLPLPTKTNNHFRGWYQNENFTGEAEVQIEKGSYGNKIYYAKWEPYKEYSNEPLSKVLTDEAVSDGVKSLFVINEDGVHFVNPYGVTNGNGYYYREPTKNDQYPIYYYRGQVANNNVIFGGFCWLIVRTTDVGGTKIIYNGVPENGKCLKTGKDTFIASKVQYNTNRVESIGYTYMGTHPLTVVQMSTIANGYVFGNDVKYENGKYKLIDTVTKDSTFTNNADSFLTHHHYTCLSTTDECEEVRYVYMLREPQICYTKLTGGEKIEDLIENKNFDVNNDTNSKVKTSIDTWYSNNLVSKTNMLEDAVWCNDRSTSRKGGWDKDTSPYEKVFFSPTVRVSETSTPSVICPNKNDSYTVSPEKGNGGLTYPIALLTADEVNLAGYAWFQNSNNNYLDNGNLWWTMSPSLLSANYAYVDVVYSILDNVNVSYTTSSASLTSGGVRPAIVLKNGTIILNGNGSRDNPFIIQE